MFKVTEYAALIHVINARLYNFYEGPFCTFQIQQLKTIQGISIDVSGEVVQKLSKNLANCLNLGSFKMH